MTSLLQVNLVKYECSCGSWFPLCQLYYCRKCNQLKCPVCLNEEIDIVFCPHCMENNSNSDAQQKKHRCNICHECPLCSSLLVTNLDVAPEGGGHCSLQCNACQWTSRDSGIEEQMSSIRWPEHANPVEEKLAEILELMERLASYETVEHSPQMRRMRSSNLGHLSDDRFGLLTAYNMRKKALSVRPKSTDVRIQPTDPPELASSIFTNNVNAISVPTLSQYLKQPLCANTGKLLPQRIGFVSRNILRCDDCDNVLYKGGKNPSDKKPLIERLGREYILRQG
ncbi:dynactin p62 family domain-containing protein [Ditylenchus destructor]|nr:dynactin p62 family domain-containing protein [Ditylenchus destructor]